MARKIVVWVLANTILCLLTGFVTLECFAGKTTASPTKSPVWPTQSPTQVPSFGPTISAPSKSPSQTPSNSPTTSKPSKSPTTSKPSFAPSRTPSKSPSRAPTKTAVSFDPVIAVDQIIFEEPNTIHLDVMNILSSQVDVSFTACDASSAEWISIPVASGLSLNSSETIRFLFDVLVSNVPVEISYLETSIPLIGCITLNATNTIGTQLYNITVESRVALRCEPGSSSMTGTNSPNACTLCSLGTFSNSSSATSCTECPSNIPRTVAIGMPSVGDCEDCPLGYFCPVGLSPVKCPWGAYEPLGATILDRRPEDCVRSPCAPKWFCGSGAAENGSYVQLIEYANLSGLKILIKQRKTFGVPIQNLGNQSITVILSSSNPDWVVSGSTSVIPPFGEAVLEVTFDSALIDSERLASSFDIEWYLDASPTERFLSPIYVEIQVVTIIVSPSTFSYEFIVDDGQIDGQESVIEVFNTLCFNSVTFSVAPTCNGMPMPTWISFPLSSNAFPFAPRIIEEQRGLPERYEFGFDLNDSIFAPQHPDSSSDAFLNPSPIYQTCFNLSLVLNGLDSTLRQQIPLTIKVKRPCPPGLFSPTGLDTEGCNPCTEGYFQDSTGATFCQKCPDSFPRTRTNKSTNVNQCIPDVGGFLSENGTLQKCPRGATCNQVGLTVDGLTLLPGFWRASAKSTRILDCPRPRYCVGGRIKSSPLSARTVRLLTDPEYPGNVSNAVCRQNHTGVFCYACIPGFYKRTSQNICMACDDTLEVEDRNRVLGIFISIGLVLVVFLVAFFFWSFRQHRVRHGQLSQKAWEMRVNRIYNALDISIPLQIVIGFVQVVGSMSITFQSILPPFFSQLRDAFSILALDVIQVVDFGCTLYYKNHYASLLVITLLPIIISLLILTIHITLTHTVAKFDALLRQELRNTSFSAFLVLLFLVYPSCSVRILATFACMSFDDGRSALVSDPSVECTTDIFQSYQAYAIFMTFVYPVGIPVFYSALLYRERKALNPDTPGNRLEKVAFAVREKDHNLRYLRFLFRPYKTRFFWFETFELIRKLAQTSVVIFVASGSSGQIIFQILVTTISIVVLNALLPYAETLNNMLALLAQWVIFAIAVISLMTKLNGLGISVGLYEYDQHVLDAILVLLFIAVPVAALILVTVQVIGRGALRDICVCVNWNKVDIKVKMIKDVSIRKLNFGGSQRVVDGKPSIKESYPDIAQSFDIMHRDEPRTLPEAQELSRRLRDNLNIARRDLTEKYEQERTKVEIMEDERTAMLRRAEQLEAELESSRIELLDQEKLASEQAALAKDALARAQAGADTNPPRRTLWFLGRISEYPTDKRRIDHGAQRSDLSLKNTRGEDQGSLELSIPEVMAMNSNNVFETSVNPQVDQSQPPTSLTNGTSASSGHTGNISPDQSNNEIVQSVVVMREREGIDGSSRTHEVQRNSNESLPLSDVRTMNTIHEGPDERKDG